MFKLSRLRVIAFAVIGLCAVELSQAQAGILVSIQQLNPAVPLAGPFFFYRNATPVGSSITVGDLTNGTGGQIPGLAGSIESTTSNVPGTPVQGNIATTFNIGTWVSPANSQLVITAEAWNNSGSPIFDPNPTTALTAAQLAAVLALGRAPFTGGPVGPPYFITSDVNMPGADPTLAAGAQNITNFYGNPGLTLNRTVTSNFDPASNNGERSVTLPSLPGAVFPYGLGHQLIITNTDGPQTFTSLAASARSTVTAVPEPSTLIGGTIVAAMGLVVARLRIRRSRSEV